MGAGLAVFAVIWCMLALFLGVFWASGLMMGGILALVVGGALQAGLRERRRSAWIASGEAVRSLETLEVGFDRLWREIEVGIGHPLAPTQRGASLTKETFAGGLKTLGKTAEEVTQAVNRLGRGLSGTASPQRTKALLSNLRVVIAPALAELAHLQALRVRPEDEEGHRLLAATFTGVLRQIGDWASFGKDRVRAACADLTEGRSANVELPLVLVPPLELPSLHAWFEARGWWDETPPTSSAPRSSGLIAGLAVGYMLTTK